MEQQNHNKQAVRTAYTSGACSSIYATRIENCVETRVGGWLALGNMWGGPLLDRVAQGAAIIIHWVEGGGLSVLQALWSLAVKDEINLIVFHSLQALGFAEQLQQLEIFFLPSISKCKF